MSPAKRTAESTEALRASLIDHARQLVEREGPSALTMRALAAEAGCATGLPYKVFADRQELVLELVHSELARLQTLSSDLVARAGTGSVGDNLTWLARQVLQSPGVALAQEVTSHEQMTKGFTKRVHESGIGPASIEQAFATYLTAEQDAGRVDDSIDVDAFASLLGGAVHNLVVSGEAYPRPTQRQLRRRMTAIADALGGHTRPRARGATKQRGRSPRPARNGRTT